MSQRYEKLKVLLQELFQLDQPDLDFGLYRVMHAKSAEVSQFLDKDLLPQVKQAFSLYKTADKSEIEKELAKVVASVEAAGMDPALSPKVKELRTRLASEAVDIAQLESEVYDHLYSFFRRYYSEGDFLAKRVYKPGVYAVPYEGEETTLYWANKDQYYIKTSEYLRDYAFRLRPRDDKKPMRVHFRLVDAAEGEQANVKAVEGKDRVFILAGPGESGQDFIGEEDSEQGKELSIRFEYRPATLTDWPEVVREGKSKPPAQKDLIVQAVESILSMKDDSILTWIEELGKSHTKADGEDAGYSKLEWHLKHYFERNTFDYFIHQELAPFLRRELDFYIKNEIMHLDDIENTTAPRVEQVAALVHSLDIKPDWKQQMAKVAVTTYEGPSLELLQEKRRRIVRGFVDDGYPEAEYRRRLAEIDGQIAQTNVVAPPAIEEAVELFSNIPMLWSEASQEERQLLLRSLVELVYVDIKTKRVTALKPTPALRMLYGAGINTGPDTPVKLMFRGETPILLDLVETGEESALSSLRVASLVKERRAYGVEFTSFSSDVRKT